MTMISWKFDINNKGSFDIDQHFYFGDRKNAEILPLTGRGYTTIEF